MPRPATSSAASRSATRSRAPTRSAAPSTSARWRSSASTTRSAWPRRAARTASRIPPRELPGTPRLLRARHREAAARRERARSRSPVRASERARGSARHRLGALLRELFPPRPRLRGVARPARVGPHARRATSSAATRSRAASSSATRRARSSSSTRAPGRCRTRRSFGEPIKSCVAHADTYKAPPASGRRAAARAADRRGGLEPRGDASPPRSACSSASSARSRTRARRRRSSTSPRTRAPRRSSSPTRAPRSPRVATARRTCCRALGKHYDFLRDVLASPPVGPIADALAAMKEPKGAPLLASHLLDPADTDDDVRRAAGGARDARDEGRAADAPPLLRDVSRHRGERRDRSRRRERRRGDPPPRPEGRPRPRRARREGPDHGCDRAHAPRSAPHGVAGEAGDTEAPATDKPATDKPATDKPATDKPATPKT